MRGGRSESAGRELAAVVERLVRSLNPVAVVLFGSRARGDWGPWSDYDLLIIAEFEVPYLERIALILETIGDTRLPIEPHPYTLGEALEMLRRGSPTIVDAIEEGAVLYKGRGFERLLEEYRRLKRLGLRRTRTSIVVPGEPDR